MAQDVLVLTKPLGTHIACSANQWMNDDREKWVRIKVVLNQEDTEKAFQRAMASMARLNKVGEQLWFCNPLHLLKVTNENSTSHIKILFYL